MKFQNRVYLIIKFDVNIRKKVVKKMLLVRDIFTNLEDTRFLRSFYSFLIFQQSRRC